MSELERVPWWLSGKESARNAGDARDVGLIFLRPETGRGTTAWFQIGKGVRQGCVLSPCLFNLYAEYILRNPGLDEVHAGIKIPGRNINNPRYANDMTLTAETKKN